MNSSRILALFAVVVIVFGAVVFLRGQPTGIAESPSEEAPVVGDATYVEAVPSAAKSDGEMPRPNTDSAANGPSVLDDLRAQDNNLRVHAERLEMAWDADPISPDPSLEIEDGLVAKFDTERMLELRDQPAEVVGVNCRSHMCRVEAVFPEQPRAA